MDGWMDGWTIALETLINSLLDSEILSPWHLPDLEGLEIGALGRAAAARPGEGRACVPPGSPFSWPGKCPESVAVPEGPCHPWDCPWTQMSLMLAAGGEGPPCSTCALPGAFSGDRGRPPQPVVPAPRGETNVVLHNLGSMETARLGESHVPCVEQSRFVGLSGTTV